MSPTLPISKSVPNNIAESPSPAKFEQQEQFHFIVNKHIKPVVIENLGSRKESLRTILQGAIQETKETVSFLMFALKQFLGSTLQQTQFARRQTHSENSTFLSWIPRKTG